MPTIILNATRLWQTRISTISTFNSIAQESSTDYPTISGYFLEEKGPSTIAPNQDRRIPAGVYHLKWHNSSRFKRVLPLLHNANVSESRYILIHNGNTADDTEGCLLAGSTRSRNFVGNSVLKLNELIDFLNCYDLDSGKYAINISESF